MSVIIEPNYELLLNIIIIGWVIGSPFKILFGLKKTDKSNYDRYDWGDVFDGVLKLIIVGSVLVFR